VIRTPYRPFKSASARFRPAGLGLALAIDICFLPFVVRSETLAERLTPSPNATSGAARASAGVPARTNAYEGYVNFSFDQVDIASFVKLVGDMTGRRFAVGDGVTGKITLVSPRISRQELYPLFVAILESVGCSVVREGDVERVVPIPRRETPSAPVVGTGEPVAGQGYQTKVFRLENVSASEVRRVLESRVGGGKGGAVSAVEETNHLIVTDTADSLRQIEKIIRELDRPGLARTMELVSLQFASANDLAAQLNVALTERETRGEQIRNRLPAVGGSAGDRRAPVVVPATHANGLVLVGTQAQIADLKRIISQMDVDVPSGRGRLNAIFLKYIAADEAAKSLNALLGRAVGPDKKEPLERSIAIEAHAPNNALLVDASPGDYEVVQKLVGQLDRLPEQVHIEVMIVEHNVGDGLTLGTEFVALDKPDKPGDTTIQGGSLLKDGADTLMKNVQNGLFPQGLTVGVASGDRVDENGNVVVSYPGVINIAAVKSDSRFEVVSETSLEGQNNKEATVNIVNQIPILKSTIQGGSGTSRDVIQNIDRLDVGIKLKLTPHIVPGGEVQMLLNPSIEAVVDTGPSATDLTPTIARREVSTTVTVPSGRTIVIAGLTREDRKKSVRRVPILSKLPFVGWLFSYKVDLTEKTEMIILVTPKIVADDATAQKLREEWEKKTGLRKHESK
jgi:general secretion pathway protein D